jgi:hypothetical protein
MAPTAVGSSDMTTPASSADVTQEAKRKFQATVILLGTLQTLTKLHGLSPRANYTDRATASCRRSDCQLLRIEGVAWSE